VKDKYMHSVVELEHATRARWLLQSFTNDPAHSPYLNDGTVNNLAEFLHQQYRAAAKALAVMHNGCERRSRPILHDHGWGDCYGKKKQYFLRRARWLLTDYPSPNGRLGGKS